MRSLSMFGWSVVAMSAIAHAQDTARVSIDSAGGEGNDVSGRDGAAMIGSGAKSTFFFASDADDLVAGDTNGERDLFEHFPTTGTTTRLVMGASGAEPNDGSNRPLATPDGRYVAFTSGATNLVATDTNGHNDAFVVDRSTGKCELVSLAYDGSQADDFCIATGISDDGRYVIFISGATNLVKVDANGAFDVFVRDRKAATTECVSVNVNGDPGNGFSNDSSISADGERVAFASSADDLVAKDTNTSPDCFVRDLAAGTTTRESLSYQGGELNGQSGNARITADGEWLAFLSVATDVIQGGTVFGIAHVYVRSLATGEVWLASQSSISTQGSDQGDAFSGNPRVALLDGWEPIVCFQSWATNLVPGDTNSQIDVFAARVLYGSIQRVDVASDGSETHPGPIYPWDYSLAPDATQVCFSSDADDLVAGDANGVGDAFVRGLCWTTFYEFGSGTPGSGGFVPRLFGLGGSCEASHYSVHVADGLGGAAGHLWIGTKAGATPMAGGYLYLDLTAPFLLLPIALGGAIGVAGAGSLDLDGANVEGMGPAEVYLQCTFIDPAAKKKIALSNMLVFGLGQ